MGEEDAMSAEKGGVASDTDREDPGERTSLLKRVDLSSPAVMRESLVRRASAILICNENSCAARENVLKDVPMGINRQRSMPNIGSNGRVEINEKFCHHTAG